MLNKKSIDDINVKGKRVLVRCDFNVPLQEGKITENWLQTVEKSFCVPILENQRESQNQNYLWRLLQFVCLSF